MGPPLKGVTYAEFHVYKDGQSQVIRLDQGKITAVDSSSITLSESDGSSVTIALDEDTKVLAGPGNDSTVDDLSVGQRVIVCGPEGGAAKTVIVPPKPTELVQPRETPPVKPPPATRDDDDDDDEPAGVKGGTKGGTIGGTIGGKIGGEIGGTPGGTVGGVKGGTGPATGGPKILRSDLAALQKISGADPKVPPILDKPGVTYTVTAWVCVSPAGKVYDVKILKKADPLLDANVVAALKLWVHRPVKDENGLAVPYCYTLPLEFREK